MLLNRGCKKIKRLLVDYLENSLGESSTEGQAKLKEEEAQLVKGHLLRCNDCKSYRDNLKEVLENVRLLKDPELPDNFWDNYVSNFRKRLEEEPTPERNILPEYPHPSWQLKLPRLASSIALLILLIGIAFSIYLPKKENNIKYTSLEEIDIEEYGSLDTGLAEYLLNEVEENPVIKEYVTGNIAYEISNVNGLIAHENGDIGTLLDELSEEENDILRNDLMKELVS